MSRYILGGRADVPQVSENCWKGFGGLGSMSLIHEDNKLEYQRFGFKEKEKGG